MHPIPKEMEELSTCELHFRLKPDLDIPFFVKNTAASLVCEYFRVYCRNNSLMLWYFEIDPFDCLIVCVARVEQR